MKSNYLVYHDSCLDGFLSGMVAYYKAKFFGVKNLVVLPANYADTPVKPNNVESVTLVDFSYPMDILTELAFNGIHVTVVDHHKTFIDSFLQYDDSIQHKSSMVSSYPERKQDHILKYHPVNGRPLFADVSVMNRNGRDTKFEFYLNNNEVKDKNSEYVHSGASLCFHIATSETTGEGVKQLLLDKTKGEITELIRLARIHDLWIHKGDEMSDAYALSHWFKKFHKANRDLIDEMKEFPDLSSAIFEQLLEKFNADTLAFKIKEAKEELESINEKLEALATSDAVKDVQLNHYHPDGAKICYVDSDEVRSLGISIVGSYMTRKKGWDVAIMNAFTDEEKHVYSLRSNESTTNVDVATICNNYFKDEKAVSGGGHTNAAGVAFAKEKKDTFFTVLSKDSTEVISLKIDKELHASIVKLSQLKGLTFDECVAEILDDATYKGLFYAKEPA